LGIRSKHLITMDGWINMKIEVTQKNINEGQGNCGHYCAIALAIRDKFNTDDVYVTTDYNEDCLVRIQVKDKEFVVNDPVVEDFISDFDCGVDVEPIQFNMEVKK